MNNESESPRRDPWADVKRIGPRFDCDAEFCGLGESYPGEEPGDYYRAEDVDAARAAVEEQHQQDREEIMVDTGRALAAKDAEIEALKVHNEQLMDAVATFTADDSDVRRYRKAEAEVARLTEERDTLKTKLAVIEYERDDAKRQYRAICTAFPPSHPLEHKE